MATKHKIPGSSWRAYIEGAFAANSVRKTMMPELYRLAIKQPEIVVTSEPMFGLSGSGKSSITKDVL